MLLAEKTKKEEIQKLTKKYDDKMDSMQADFIEQTKEATTKFLNQKIRLEEKVLEMSEERKEIKVKM